MSPHALRFVRLAAFLAAAVVSTGSTAAGDPLPLPEGFVEAGEPVSGTAERVEREIVYTDTVLTDTSAAGMHADWLPAKPTTGGWAKVGADTGDSSEGAAPAPDAEAKAPPASRLLQSLGERAAQPAPSPAPAEQGNALVLRDADPVSGAAGTPGADILHGCPRALLGSLLASATDAGDAVSALAIERETLALCRERQEIVNGVVALEGELETLLAEAHAKVAGPVQGPVGSAVADAPIVKVSAPVRVVSLPPPVSAAGEAPKAAEAPEHPAPPSYFWFSIIGTAGDLRAGVSGGARGGASVWFVREGDRLPGGVTVMRIVTRPPGVHVDGALEAALPYRPRPAGAAGQRENTPSGGSTPPGGSTPSGGGTAGDGS